jgi:DNA-binding MarR family transcriptional regulator
VKGARRPHEIGERGAGPGDPVVALHECTVHDGLRHLVQLLPRVMRGLRRRPGEPIELEGVTLGPRHGTGLALLREDESTVGALASALGLNLATVSGVVADLERVGFVERSADPADRRRTIVRIRPGHEGVVDAWLEGATAPLVRTLRQLSPYERAVFIKAMGYLDAELNASSEFTASSDFRASSDKETA